MYVYIEYPKCLYQKDGATLVVENAEEEEGAAQLGWLTAQQYHNPTPVNSPPAPEKEAAEEESSEEEIPESDGVL